MCKIGDKDRVAVKDIRFIEQKPCFLDWTTVTIPSGQLRNRLDPTCGSSGIQKFQFGGKNLLGEGVSELLVFQASPSRLWEAAAVMVPRGCLLFKVAADHGTYQLESGLVGMQNTKVTRSWKLALRFQRKAWETRESPQQKQVPWKSL